MPKQTVPVVICEYHQEVLQYIHRFIASKKLPFTKLKMIHLDSHPDLGFPKNLVAQDCFNKEKLYNNLEIADWILPLMYSGHLEKLIWLKPPWAEQIPNCKSSFAVGEEKNSKSLRVTCTEDYFLEDGLYACSEQLDNSKTVVLQVCKVSDLHYEILQNCKDKSSSLHSRLEFLNDGAKKVKLDNSLNHSNELIPIDDEKYILDIDLDYFSVMNPFLKDYTEEEYSKLKHIYKVSFPKEKGSTEDLVTFVAKTQIKLQQLEDVIKKFAANSEIEETLENEEILTFLRQLKIRKSGENIDWDLVHVAGLTTELPHHVSSEEKIDNLVQEMVLLLKHLPPPSLITIARSAEDEYCPPNQVDMIERDVLKALQNVYSNMDITFDYKDLTRLC